MFRSSTFIASRLQRLITSSKPPLHRYLSESVYIQPSTATETGITKKLFTPGPLEVSYETKYAMLKDLGHRDPEFGNAVKFIRQKLLDIAYVSGENYTTVPIQGSGTFAVEAVFGTTVPRKDGKVLIITNGAYGKRIVRMLDMMGIDKIVLEGSEDAVAEVQAVRNVLSEVKDITAVCMVHCETSTGVVHPVEAVGKAIKELQPSANFIVDAMSSFGGIPLNLIDANIDFMISSANKCIEGVPGFAYVIANKDKLLQYKGCSQSLSLDLVDQYLTLEKTGLFRFTAPTHTMLAFKKALEEFEEEGGILGRAARYKKNRNILRRGMKEMGFKEFLDDTHDGYIITSYFYPEDPNFSFEEFDVRLGSKGQGIYPGQLTEARCFRLGNIGQLYPHDMECLLKCIKEVLIEMNVKVPLCHD
ncbi:2-aminoethylphosphonate--pyruvate transaminase-like isoform X1 [Rhopilema esculentum]|uniref:2-aminoethylphosphonate--pyruvate transaminase-like isoform X1 n=2 Tax=Rhopilema esculentum TaxID=499914 RepID=UPI0031CF26E7